MEKDLENSKEKKIITSWNTIVYNTLKEEPLYQNLKKYISKRIFREFSLLNISSLSYWFMLKGFYNYTLQKYCIISTDWEGSTVLNLLKFLKRKLALKFYWNRKNNLLILSRKSEKYLEFYLNSHLFEEFSWKIKNYQISRKYYEYINYLIIYLRYFLENTVET